MNFHVLTLFPEMVRDGLNTSILKRAADKNLISINAVQIRDYTLDKHNKVDDYTYGGGAGMLMQAQPVYDCCMAVQKSITDGNRKPARVVFVTPRGFTFNQQMAADFAKEEDLIFLCGHYEGIDERVNDYVDELLSIGDYVLTGGEIPSMAVIDSVVRLLDGAITADSLKDESFNEPILEYPQYTEPYDFEGKTVPDLLYSGNHEAINKWRRKQALLLTREHRPDLFKELELSKQDKKLLAEAESGETPAWEKTALEKGHKFIK